MDHDAFSDVQLVLLFAAGDRAAFDALFRRHNARVWRLAMRMVGGRADAEEILQEVFMRVARAAPDWQPRARFTTWLDRVTINRCLTYRERRGKGRVVLLPGLERLATAAPSPWQRARDHELARNLDQRVQELPDALCSAFTLVALEGRSYADAAEVLEAPVGTVKTHVHRARLLLRRRMAHELDEGSTRGRSASE